MLRLAVFVFASASACGVVGCGERGHRDAKGAPVTSGRAPAAAGLVRAEPTTLPPLVPLTLAANDEQWARAVRAGDFREAMRRFDALPADRLGTPELRYVRARVAIGVGDFARGSTLLAGLEHELPLLGDAIVLGRADCALEVGPFDQAARVFGARTDAASLVKAGIAWERAAAFDKARAALDRALRLLGTDNGAEASLRRVEALSARVRVARALHDVGSAATDLRFLAVEAPATDAGFRAEAELRELVPPSRLTAEQRLTRAQKLAEAGRVDDALAGIDALAKNPGEKPAPAAVLHARGWAYYSSRSDYSKAAEFLEQASHLGGQDAVRRVLRRPRSRSRRRRRARHRTLPRSRAQQSGVPLRGGGPLSSGTAPLAARGSGTPRRRRTRRISTLTESGKGASWPRRGTSSVSRGWRPRIRRTPYPFLRTSPRPRTTHWTAPRCASSKVRRSETPETRCAQ